MIACVQRRINLKKKVHIKKRVDIKKKVSFNLDDPSIYSLVLICSQNNISPSTAVKLMIQKSHKKLIHYEARS